MPCLLSDVSIFSLSHSMSPRACSEFRLLRPCHQETPPLPRTRVDRPIGLGLGSFPQKKMGVLKFCRVLPTNRRNSTKLDETRRIESRCRLSHFCHFESTRVEMRVDLVSFLLDVLSKLCGAVPKLKEHFLHCIPHQAHDSQHCICPWMLFQQLHFVLVAFILMGRSDLDDVINC